MSDVDDDGDLSPSQPQTQFIPGDDDEGQMWDVVEILEENGRKYKVRWKDTRDKKTGEITHWPPSWVYKHDCTDDLIAAWKRQKKRKAMAKKSAEDPPFNASSKSKKRSESTSTTATARRSRRKTHEPIPSTSTHPPPGTAKPRARSTRTSPQYSRSKRRKVEPDPSDAERETAHSSRPHKRRKVEVEIVFPSLRHPVPKFTPETVARKRSDEAAMLREDLRGEGLGTHPNIGSKEQAKPVKEKTAVGVVPLSKVGPPRGLKRRRAGKNREIVASCVRDGVESLSPPPAAHRSPRSLSGGKENPHKPLSLPADSASSPRRSPKDTNATSRSHSSHALARLADESDSEDEELSYANTFTKVLKLAKSRSGSLSAETRGLLAREEEEDTQEAAGFVLPSSSPPCRLSRPPSVERQPSGVSGSPSRHEKAEPSRSNGDGKNIMQGRPSGNDTFSREGIVPETQPTSPPHSSHQRAHEPSQSPHNALDRDLPSTPPRTQMQRPSTSHVASSVKSKMRRKRGFSKELRPVPRLSPSVFRPHLPPADDDEIDQFSSPEKDARRKAALTLDPFTQDTIEAAEFTQEQADALVDWDGGIAPDDENPFADGEGNELSLGPDLPAPDGFGGSRRAMTTVFAQSPATAQDRLAENPVSPGTSIGQEPPPTSTTQRAEADSQSQLELHDRLAELHATLGEKEQQLVEVENQVETLQALILELRAGKAQDTADFEAKLTTLQNLSDDKSEQISQLESQLVELQLQLTQMTSESENERAQHETRIQALNESLEERDEQVSQLESALVELQTEVAEMAAENEKLAAAQELASADDHAGKLAVAQQKVAALEQELASARGQLSEVRQEATTLAVRLEATEKDWERRFKYAESDRDLFKNLYSEASTHAARLAKENAELEERAARAESQVRDGLAMVRGTFEAQAAKLRGEVEKWQGLCKVLQEKDKRTDDEVRRRAALEPQLREENERLLREAEIVRSDMEKMADIITLMREQRWRSDDAMNEGYQDEDDAPAQGDMDEEDAPDSTPPYPGFLDEDTDDTEKYGCQHVYDATMCHYMFSTVQELIKHVRKAHYLDIENFEL
ncbi:hypothetical protein C8Q79DRAFT_1005287 [Trametes meyenii]|nr:hypothetical protein C8Q79DRAFT_1005287 [Trametes meyenii]